MHGFLIRNKDAGTSPEQKLNKSDNSSFNLQARKGKIFLAASPLHDEVIQFLINEGVKIIMIGTGKPETN